MTNQESTISTALDELTCELIGRCLDILAEGGDVWPTLTYCGAAGASCATALTFNEDGLEDCLAEARAQAGDLDEDVTCYALAYEGFVQLDETGEATDALIVEFGERGAKTAYSAFVPYAVGRTPDDFRCGDPQPAGEEPLLLK